MHGGDVGDGEGYIRGGWRKERVGDFGGAQEADGGESRDSIDRENQETEAGLLQGQLQEAEIVASPLLLA